MRHLQRGKDCSRLRPVRPHPSLQVRLETPGRKEPHPDSGFALGSASIPGARFRSAAGGWRREQHGGRPVQLRVVVKRTQLTRLVLERNQGTTISMSALKAEPLPPNGGGFGGWRIFSVVRFVPPKTPDGCPRPPPGLAGRRPLLQQTHWKIPLLGCGTHAEKQTPRQRSEHRPEVAGQGGVMLPFWFAGQFQGQPPNIILDRQPPGRFHGHCLGGGGAPLRLNPCRALDQMQGPARMPVPVRSF